MYSTVNERREERRDNKRLHSAAWRISLWATLAFAFGTALVFAGLHQFVASDIQRRSDAWLSGEVGTLGDVAERTPKDRLYDRVVGEVAELASREVPNRSRRGRRRERLGIFSAGGADGAGEAVGGSGRRAKRTWRRFAPATWCRTFRFI